MTTMQSAIERAMKFSRQLGQHLRQTHYIGGWKPSGPVPNKFGKREQEKARKRAAKLAAKLATKHDNRI